MNFSVVIPAYNEIKTIRGLVLQALTITPNVIVVDDGSTDGTATEIKDLPIKLIVHTENQGKAASLWDGIQSAINSGSEAIITLDGDGQHSPMDIPLLLDKAKQFPETIIIGARLADKHTIPTRRYYANKIANFWISWASGYQIADSQSGFRLYPASVFDNLSVNIDKSKSFVFESEILIKVARKGIYSCPVAIPAVYSSDARQSHFRSVHDIAQITRMVSVELLKHGLHLPGLYNAWIKPLFPTSHYDQSGIDGYFTLFLSILVILLTGGLSFFIAYGYIFKISSESIPKILRKPSLFIVLGRKLVNNYPDRDYQYRLNSVLHLLDHQSDSDVLILGGYTGKANVSESKSGKDYLLERDIRPEAVEIEESSRNTLENLQQARTLLRSETRQIILISNRYHLARSQIMANGFGLYPIIYPADEKFMVLPSTLLHILSEAFHLHWYLTGKYFAKITNNEKMLARIS
jgi:glycosyltransferase involved in cell wall biosynthesis